jgi:hypothetical protein
MVIRSDKFIQDIILFIRNVLRERVTDPLINENTFRTEGFVMTAYPARKVQYPIITIKQTNISTQKLGMASEMQYATINVEVRIWARNSKEVDEMTGEVIDILRDLEFDADGTSNEEIHGFRLLSCIPIVEVGSENNIHSKVLNFGYAAILT